MLDEMFRSLDLQNGQLLRPSDLPTDQISPADWRAAGEWLILAQRMNAERVFFVQDNPVIVFSEITGEDSATELLRAYRRAWSMARPRCLFIVTDDEIRVYSLSTPPVDSVERIDELSPLAIVSRAADVAEVLAEYRRERIEDGSLFENSRFSSSTKGADEQFLSDVETATRLLEAEGLPQRVAHGLIERVVLIRYLEDREVLTAEYFDRLVAQRGSWQQALSTGRFSAAGPTSSFLACLDDMSLTQAVFQDLASNFNGDLFVVTDDEEALVNAEHLRLLQRLFSGEGFSSDQESLFLWAYDFSVVPTSLISSMYEQFYHADTSDDSGTYYTPSELVEYVLTRTLTEDVLARAPRICDAACGSGIFLVEAFRRVVRHEMVSNPEGFTPARLRSLLIERVAGIDTNAEAIRLAAFSLYLAYLNYLSPRDILSAEPLPRLISRGNMDGESTVLVISDAFNETATEASDKLSDLTAIPWANGSFDVVVGNPPWTEPRSSRKSSLADKWARDRDLPVGDRSLSQLFLWRALTLLREGGTSGLLIAATVFGNARSGRFRSSWLGQVELEAIVNFTPVRRLFFKGAIAPFALVQFKKRVQDEMTSDGRRFDYLTMIPSSALANSRSLAYARSERKWVNQASLQTKDYLWKTYFWGNHRDATLMLRLDAEDRLVDALPGGGPRPAYGYQWGNGREGHEPSSTLASLQSLKRMESWGPIQNSWLEPINRRVKREPDERLYSGPRILVSRGVRTGFGPRVRFVDQPLAFRHNFYCVPTAGLPEYVAKSLAGILLSSLGRYRIFMTSGSWGLWHDSVVPDDILNVPVRIDERWTRQLEQIADAVDHLHRVEDADLGLFRQADESLDEIFERLDGLVFDLFELTSAERTLIDDFHRYTLDLATRQERSSAVLPLKPESEERQQGLRSTLTYPLQGMAEYLDMFLSIWDKQLEPEGKFSWRLLATPRSPFVAAVFETQNSESSATDMEQEAWSSVLERLSRSLSRPVTQSVRVEGVIRAVSDTSITIVKRNEVRLWSPSAAIDDAEATMLQAMALDS